MAVAAGCVLGLHHLAGAVPGPASWSGAALVDWASETNPVVVALAVVRLAALAVGYQLLGSAMLATVGCLAHAPSLLRASDLVALPGVRGLVRHAAAATLSASTLLASPALPGSGHPATLRVIGSGPTVTLTVDPPDPGSEVTLSVETAPPTAPTPAASPAPAIGPDTWTVARGDHLWSIAERTLAQRWGRVPSESEVDRYWRAVVAANADLADPDLVFVGQQVAVPPVPAP